MPRLSGSLDVEATATIHWLKIHNAVLLRCHKVRQALAESPQLTALSEASGSLNLA